MTDPLPSCVAEVLAGLWFAAAWVRTYRDYTPGAPADVLMGGVGVVGIGLVTAAAVLWTAGAIK